MANPLFAEEFEPSGDGRAGLHSIFLEMSPASGEGSDKLAVQWTGEPSAALSAWIDFDGDGVWREDEKVVSERLLTEGMTLFDVEAPLGVERAARGMARFRIVMPDGASWERIEELWNRPVAAPAMGLVEKGTPGCGWESGFHPPGVQGSSVFHGVEALIVWDDGGGPALYAGGTFTFAGTVAASNIAKWDGTQWSDVGGGVNSTVYTLAIWDDGGGSALYAGGVFRDAGGGRVERIAKWDGVSWSALDGGMSDAVQALAVWDDGGGPALYAGGVFLTAGGTAAQRVAKWNGTSWSALGSGIDAVVYALQAFDDGMTSVLVAGGNFSTAGGVATTAIAQWNGAGWQGMGGSGMDAAVRALTVWDDGGGAALYAGGDFTSSGGVSVSHVARWNGAAWSALGLGTSGTVEALAVWDDGGGAALHVGGRFSDAGGAPAERIASWDGASWSSLGGGATSWVLALAGFDAGQGEDLFVGGQFESLADIGAAAGIALWDGHDWSKVSPPPSLGLNDQVRALCAFDDGGGLALHAGGDFTHVGASATRAVARLDDAAWSALGGPHTLRVHALEVWDDGDGAALYVGGSFVSMGGLSTSRIAKWDGASWSTLGTGMNGDVSALEVWDDGGGEALYAGGDFTDAGGVSAIRVAKWDGASWAAIDNGGPNRAVDVLQSFDDGGGPTLFVGGDFTVVDGVTGRNRLIRWNGSAWLPLGSGASDRVYAMEVWDDGDGAALFVGGAFTTVDGVAASRIASWDGSTWSPLGLGVTGTVYAMTVFDDGDGEALYVGGNFTGAGGLGTEHIARWGGTGWSAVGAGVNSTIYALESFDDGDAPALYAGGIFTTAGGVVAARIAKYSCPALAAVPILRLPELTSVSEGETVDLPITLETDGQALASLAFSIDYEAACLDPDVDDDGMLDVDPLAGASVPGDFTVTVLFDAADGDGEIDISIVDASPPIATLPDGELLRLAFQTACPVPTSGPAETSVDFSLQPEVSFGDPAGQAVDGLAAGGTVRIWSGLRGDCNLDGALGAADLTSVVLEIFDADGNVWTDAPGSTFAGSPTGCDANANQLITAADVTCANLLLFGNACGARGAVPAEPPRLEILTTSFDGEAVWLGARLVPNGNDVASLAFSLDLDPARFDLAQVDANGDGRPDRLRFPQGESGLAVVSWATADADGELDVLLADLSQQALGEGLWVEIGIPATTASNDGVALSVDPAASFGSVTGLDLVGTAVLATDLFADGFESADTTAWSLTE